MQDTQFLLLAALIVGLSTFIVTMISTDAAIMLLIVAMLLSPEFALGAVSDRAVVVRLDDLLLGVIFFTWLAKLAINKQLGIIRSTPLNLPVIAFIIACCLSTGWGMLNATVRNPLASFFYLAKYVQYFLLFFMVANVVHDRHQVKRMVKAALFTAGCVTAYGYAQIASHGPGYRITAPFEGLHAEPNTMAGYLMLMMAVALGLALYASSPIKRALLVGLAAAMVPPFLFTYSRGGYLGFVGMYVTFCLFSRRFQSVLWVLLALGLICAPFLVPKTVVQRVSSTFETNYGHKFGQVRLSQSPAYRLLVWKHIMAEWKKSPLLGLGVAGAGLVDNQYALVLGELGLLGAFTYLWVRWCLLQVAYRAYRTVQDPSMQGLSLGFLAGLVGLLIHSFGGNIFIIVRIMEPFWLLAALVAILPTLVDRPPAEAPMTLWPSAVTLPARS